MGPKLLFRIRIQLGYRIRIRIGYLDLHWEYRSGSGQVEMGPKKEKIKNLERKKIPN
jgi:hypothetical protein